MPNPTFCHGLVWQVSGAGLTPWSRIRIETKADPKHWFLLMRTHNQKLSKKQRFWRWLTLICNLGHPAPIPATQMNAFRIRTVHFYGAVMWPTNPIFSDTWQIRILHVRRNILFKFDVHVAINGKIPVDYCLTWSAVIWCKPFSVFL